MSGIEKYRKRIDEIDNKLLDLLVERFSCSGEIGRIKARRKLPVLQSARWEDIISTRKDYASKLGLDYDFVESFLELVHRESLRIQDSLIREKGENSRSVK